MSRYYNYVTRKKLQIFLKKNNRLYTLPDIYNSAETLLNEYDQTRENSVAGQQNFFSLVLSKLTEFYNIEVYQHKSWWGKILSFFNWVPKEELELLLLIKKIKKTMKEIPKSEDTLDSSIAKWGLPFLMKRVNKEIKTNLQSISSDIPQQLRYLSHRTLTDVSGVPSELEGNSFLMSFKDYLDDFKGFIQTLPTDKQSNPILKQTLYYLTQCEEYEQDLLVKRTILNLIQNLSSKDITSYAENELLYNHTFNVLNTIAEMGEGEKILFPHGFRGGKGKGGHAALFFIEKINKDQIVIHFINTGAGVQETESWKTTFKNIFVNSQTTPIKVTSPLNISELNESDLLKNLFAPTILTYPDENQASNAMIRPLMDLYQNNLLHDDKNKVTYQKMGSCSQSCIDSWLETQLSEYEILHFKIFRFKNSINKINQLLNSSLLNETQKKHCQSMRLSAYISLSKIDNRLAELNSDLKKQNKLQIDNLMMVRKENSANKGREPTQLPLEKIEEYCENKVAKDRITRFSKTEQERIYTHTEKNAVAIKKRTVAAGLTYKVTFGFFGKLNSNLTQEERAQNKVNKVLLAKNILGTQKELGSIEKLKKEIDFSSLSGQELSHTKTLAEVENTLLYDYLDMGKLLGQSYN